MSLIFNKENVMESKQMKLEDLIPEMSTMLENALKDKEEIREEIKNVVLKNSAGPQYGAVRVCNFPIGEVNKRSDESDVYCEHYKICPIYINNLRESIGQKCLFEVQKVEQLTSELVEDLGINTMTDHNDKRMLGELVTYSLIEDRAISNLACNSLQMTNITIGKNGKTFQTVQNINLQTIQMMNNLKTKVREKLIATRLERAKLNIEKQKVINTDGAQKLKNKLREIEQKLKPQKGIGLLIKESEEKTEVIDLTRPFEKEEKKKEAVVSASISFEDMFD